MSLYVCNTTRVKTVEYNPGTDTPTDLITSSILDPEDLVLKVPVSRRTELRSFVNSDTGVDILPLLSSWVENPVNTTSLLYCGGPESRRGPRLGCHHHHNRSVSDGTTLMSPTPRLSQDSTDGAGCPTSLGVSAGSSSTRCSPWTSRLRTRARPCTAWTMRSGPSRRCTLRAGSC